MQQISQDVYFDVAKHAKMWSVPHEKASEIIQEELFKLGYEWPYPLGAGERTDEVQNEMGEYLYARNGQQITYSDFTPSTGRPAEEAILEPTTTYTIKILPKKEEFVEFNGKQYSKADVEKALELLTPKGETK